MKEGLLSNAEIARQLGVSRSTVSQWAQRMKQRRRGLKGLKRNKPAGANLRLTPAHWGKVLRDLLRGAQSFGYQDSDGRWEESRNSSFSSTASVTTPTT